MDTRAQFRTVDGGDVPIEVNSHSMTSDRYIDHSRLGSHQVWKQSDDPKKPGKIVSQPNDVLQNVRHATGALKARSSFKNEGDGQQGECCGPLGGNW